MSSLSYSDRQIQKTNDFSSVSKHSMCAAGYLEDRFFQHFVAKKVKRAPIINRGYYVRMKAIDTVILDFLTDTSENIFSPTNEREVSPQIRPRLNIVVLGAGYDTLFFRLCDEHKELLDRFDVRYVEMDFLDVCINKSLMIQAQSEMTKFFSSPLTTTEPVGNEDFSVVLESQNYVLVGFDMRKTEKLLPLFEHLSLDSEAPTLILAEVVLTYIEDTHVEEIFRRTASFFQNALFVNYEQIEPADPFGRFMQQHFEKQKTPLLNIHRHPTASSHTERFLNVGWRMTACLSVCEFWCRLIPEEEKTRISTLEPFDEHEEFMEKMRHYVLALAATGDCCDIIEKNYCLSPTEDSTKVMHRATVEQSAVSVVPLSNKFAIYGHAMAEVKLTKASGESAHVVVLVGGVSKKQEAKRKSVSQMEDCVSQMEDLGPGISGIWISTSQLDSDLKRPLVHHAVIAHPSATNVVFVAGGRTSPLSPNIHVYAIELTLNEVSGEVTFLVKKGEKTALLNSEQGSIRCQALTLFDDDVALAVQSLKDEPQRSSLDYLQFEVKDDGCCVTQVPIDTIYPAAFCSVASWGVRRVVLTGGMRDDLAVANIFLFDSTSDDWPYLGEMEFPRFGHTSHIYEDHLIVIGGVSHLNQCLPDVSVFCLSTKKKKHFKLQYPASLSTKQEALVMLFNHTSLLITRNEPKRILVIGGGGNCFSFGSHFNFFPFYLELSAIL